MRILYNTTYHIDQSITDEWIVYVKEIYAPLLMATSYFDEWKLSKIYGEQKDGGDSFALQFVAKDFDKFVTYRDQMSKDYQSKMSSTFGDKCLYFKTLMEILEES